MHASENVKSKVAELLIYPETPEGLPTEIYQAAYPGVDDPPEYREVLGLKYLSNKMPTRNQ